MTDTDRNKVVRFAATVGISAPHLIDAFVVAIQNDQFAPDPPLDITNDFDVRHGYTPSDGSPPSIRFTLPPGVVSSTGTVNIDPVLGMRMAAWIVSIHEPTVGYFRELLDAIRITHHLEIGPPE